MQCKRSISFLIATLLCSGSAYAQLWEVELVGLYTQFSDDPFISARLIDTSPLAVTDSYNTRPKSSTNFRLGAKRYFSDDLDVGVEWTRLKSQGTQSLDAGEAEFLIIPSVVRPCPHGVFPQVRDHVSLRFNSVNIVLSRHFNSQYLQLRAFGGLQVTQFKTSQQTTGIIADDVPLPNTQVSTKNKFRGIGPRLGLDIELPFGQHFSLTSQLAGTALLTQREWKQDAFDSFCFECPSMRSNAGGVVPSAEASTGIAYSFFIDPVEINFRSGYQWTQYFNSLRNTLHEKTNFGYHGPYFGIHLTSA